MKGGYGGGTDLNMPVSKMDLFPTFCDLTDTKPPIQPDGKSLLPVLNKSNMTYLDERPLYWHFPAYLEGGHTESRDRIFRTRPVSVIRKGNWKLIENYEDGSLELYNLNNDVSEKTDLSKTNKEMRKQLYGLLNEWKKEVNAPIQQKK